MKNYCDKRILPVIGVVLLGCYYLYCTISILVFDNPHISNNNYTAGFVLTVYLFLAIIFAYSYIQSVRSDSGRVPSEWRRPYASDTPQINYCTKCRLYKPLRTHHCTRCGRCVLKMDHHCLWINNCVGHGNYKYFFVALTTAFLECIIMASLAILRWTFNNHEWLNFRTFLLGLQCIFVAVQLVLLGIMITFHVFLISKNMTTIDWHCCRGKGPGHSFDRGILENIKDNLGSYWWLWLCPTRIKILTDGVTFISTNIPEGPLDENSSDSEKKSLTMNAM